MILPYVILTCASRDWQIRRGTRDSRCALAASCPLQCATNRCLLAARLPANSLHAAPPRLFLAAMLPAHSLHGVSTDAKPVVACQALSLCASRMHTPVETPAAGGRLATSWVRLADLPANRSEIAAVVHGTRIYVIGGAGATSGRATASMWSLDVSGLCSMRTLGRVWRASRWMCFVADYSLPPAPPLATHSRSPRPSPPLFSFPALDIPQHHQALGAPPAISAACGERSRRCQCRARASSPGSSEGVSWRWAECADSSPPVSTLTRCT